MDDTFQNRTYRTQPGGHSVKPTRTGPNAHRHAIPRTAHEPDTYPTGGSYSIYA